MPWHIGPLCPIFDFTNVNIQSADLDPTMIRRALIPHNHNLNCSSPSLHLLKPYCKIVAGGNLADILSNRGVPVFIHEMLDSIQEIVFPNLTICVGNCKNRNTVNPQINGLVGKKGCL